MADYDAMSASPLAVSGRGFFEPNDHPAICPMQAIPSASAPGLRYKIRGQYAGATETWVAGATPGTPAPTGHATTETGHVKANG